MKHRPEYRLTSFIGRVDVFLFSLNLVLGFIYVIGSIQEFLDVTQDLILRIFEVSAISFLVVSVYYIVLIVMEMIRWRRNRFVPLLFVVTGIALVLGLFIAVEFILVIQERVQ